MFNLIHIGVLLSFVWRLPGCDCTRSGRLPTLPKCVNSLGINYNQVELPSTIMSNKLNTTFWFREQRLSCYPINYNISISLEEIAEDEIEIFQPNGLLKYNSGYYQKNEFCVQSLTDTELILHICNINCDDPTGKICVPKCCGWGNSLIRYDEGNVTCVQRSMSGVDWKPDVYRQHKHVSRCLNKNDKSERCLHLGLQDEIFHYQNIFAGCSDDDNFTLELISFDETPFAFTRDGSLRFDNYVLNSTEYCIDGLTKDSIDVAPHAALFCFSKCPDDPDADIKRNIGIFYVVAMFTSFVFLLLTVIVYILIWDKHNIHGWTVFSLSISMGIMLVFLGTARLISLNVGKDEISRKFWCVFVGILTHFFFLTTFSLLTCLSFDLWWTFRSLAPSIGKSKGIVRFRLYLLFSLGLPFIMVTIGFILDQIYDNPKLTTVDYIIPQYGVTTCYIGDKYAQGVYILLPVAILLFANLGFFLATMITMYQYHKSTQAIRKNSANQKHTFQLFAKLFFVMGVTWTVEVIEYLSVYGRPEYDSKNCQIHYAPGKAWILSDIINICQGISIFIIFVCKKQVILHMGRKHTSLQGKSNQIPSVSNHVPPQLLSTNSNLPQSIPLTDYVSHETMSTNFIDENSSFQIRDVNNENCNTDN